MGKKGLITPSTRINMLRVKHNVALSLFVVCTSTIYNSSDDKLEQKIAGT